MRQLLRFFLLIPVFACSAAISTPAMAAEPYPSKPIRIVVPYTPGGNTDLLGRLVAQHLGQAWNVPVVVENRPGAGGTIGVSQVAKSKGDGYTMVLGAFGNILVAQSLYKDLSYDPVKDLKPVILLATPPTILTATASLPVANVTELIAYAQKNPGKLNYGSSGKGTSNHLFGELFASMAKVELTHVPYKGSGPAVNDLVAGMTQLNFAPFPLVLPQIRAGKLKALAVTGATRSPALADVPTVAESGLPGYEGVGWFGLLVPSGTPDSIVIKLNKQINQILSNPQVRETLSAEGAVPIGGSPQDAVASVAAGIKKWRGLAEKIR